jgi:hypothetical protein
LDPGFYGLGALLRGPTFDQHSDGCLLLDIYVFDFREYANPLMDSK